MPVAEIADWLGGISGAVGLMAGKLGCRKKKNAPWSNVEMEIIRGQYSLGANVRL